MRRLLLSLICLAATWVAAPLRAEDWYVDNVNGDDQNNGRPTAYGGPVAGPFRTIARALRAARIGDRIVLTKTDLPYRESVTLQGLKNSGTKLAPFTIVGNGATLDGTAPIPGTAWEHVAGTVFRFLPDRMHYQQLYLDGRPLKRVRVVGGQLPELAPLQWSLLGGWVYFCAETNRVPSQYALHYAGRQVGITLYRVANVQIEDLTIQGFQLDGINAHDMATNAVIAGCRIRGNGRSGISIGGASRVGIQGCLVGDNFAAQVRTEGYCRVTIESCDLIESDSFGPPVLREGGQVLLNGTPLARAGRSEPPVPNGARHEIAMTPVSGPAPQHRGLWRDTSPASTLPGFAYGWPLLLVAGVSFCAARRRRLAR